MRHNHAPYLHPRRLFEPLLCLVGHHQLPPTTTTSSGLSGQSEATDSPLTTASTASTTSTTVPPAKSTLDVDVVVYGTQTSGIAAVREITQAAPNLRVALISPGNFLESPLAQGLCVEDARNIDEVAGGMYAQWRTSIISYYQQRGSSPSRPSGRLVYQPQVASQFSGPTSEGQPPRTSNSISGSLLPLAIPAPSAGQR